MSYHPTSPRPSPSPSADAAAALRGASLAFSKTNKPKPAPPTKKPSNGALAAALAGASHNTSSRSRSPAPPQSRHTTGGSVRTESYGHDFPSDHASVGDVRDRIARLGASPVAAAHYLQPLSAAGAAAGHARSNSHDNRSASYIAATLAASRSGSPNPPNNISNNSPTPGHQPSMSNMRSFATRSRRSDSTSSSAELPDTSSIAPTNSLISMFESPKRPATEDVDPVKKSPAVVSQRTPTAKSKPKLRPMTPERPLSPRGDETPTRAREQKEPSSPLRNEMTPRQKPRPVVKAEVKPKLENDPESRVEVSPVQTVAQIAPQVSSATQPPDVPSKTKPRVSRQRNEDAPLQPPLGIRPSQEALPLRTSSDAPKPVQVLPRQASSKDLRSRPAEDESRSHGPTPPQVPKPRKPQLHPIQPPAPRVVSRSSTQEVISPVPTRPQQQPRLRPPTPPQPRGSGAAAARTQAKAQLSIKPPLSQDASSFDGILSRHPQTQNQNRRVGSDARPTTSGTSSSNDSFVSASSVQTARPQSNSPPKQERITPNARPPSTASVPPPRSPRSPTRTLAPPLPRRNQTAATTAAPNNQSLTNLSNAIVAGSLAASRLTPSNTGTSTHSTAQPRRQRSSKMLQTLRQPAATSEPDEETRLRKHHGHHKRRNKKHFHHEGARRRWREEITERERKRYEALWASNRGVLHAHLLPEGVYEGGARPPRHNQVDVSGYVLGIVVREIWRRSRLPDDELAEVWELVYHGGFRGQNGTNNGNGNGNGAESGKAGRVPLPVAMLGKEEFVVGTWIVDQRLRGRKIPTKIGASVWDSAKGVRVLTPKMK